MDASPKGKVAIVGSGLVGRSWAVVFAKAGYQVMLYDNDDNQVKSALSSCESQLQEMEHSGILTGAIKTASKAFANISGSNSLEEVVKGAFYLQECVPENVDLKKKVFTLLDTTASPETILASSTSCIVPSLFTKELKHRNRCIVSHPINPLYYIPLVEVIASPWTDAAVIDKTRALMKDIGQAPVVAKKEVNGFILNRLQYAVIMEGWRLVEDGVCSPGDVDTAVTEGLGLRYALIGPFQTMHLNAAGVKDYCNRYGENIIKVCEEEGGPRPLKGDTLETVDAAMCRWTPLDDLEQRRKWRDSRLAGLSKHKKSKECSNE